MKRIIDWNLRRKIILHIVIIGSFTALILTLLYFEAQKNFIKALTVHKAGIITSIIENSLLPTMSNHEPNKIYSMMQKITLSSDIRKIRILSSEGKIRGSSEESETGRYAEENTLNKIEEFLSGDTHSKTYINKLDSAIQDFHLIENRTECYGCHGANDKLIGILEVDIDYTAAESLFKRSQRYGIMIGFIALLTLTLVIFRLFQKLINRPISLLKEQMIKVQEGDLEIRLIPQKKDEIGDLTESFNTMVKKLKEANNQIVALHNKQMERAGHLASLGELSAGLAHEIKNPIAGIKGAIEVISKRTDPKDSIKEIFDEILIQVEKIHSVLQDLLHYAKPKGLNIKPVNPKIPMQKAITLAKSQTHDKNIRFHFTELESDGIIPLDEDKIQEVILNILINSIAAIEEEGDIFITVGNQNDQKLEITIADNGKGIKADFLPKIFVPFFTTRKKGTGLGLSICEQIIKAHNGSIGVKSEEGKGTEFTITLPIKPI